jgi:hypothetical protein
MPLALLLLLPLSACRTEPLSLTATDGAISSCVAAGGRCARRAPDGVSACAASEYTLSGGPDFCGDPSADCCIIKCPVARPDSGSPCHTGSSCQYSDPGSCVQAICVNSSWFLEVSDCSG